MWIRDKKFVMGAIIALSGVLMAVLGGFKWYDVDITLAVSLITAGTGLMGYSVAGNIRKKRTSNGKSAKKTT